MEENHFFLCKVTLTAYKECSFMPFSEEFVVSASNEEFNGNLITEEMIKKVKLTGFSRIENMLTHATIREFFNNAIYTNCILDSIQYIGSGTKEEFRLKDTEPEEEEDKKDGSE